VSASNPAAPEPSEIAGRYQVVQKLGAGAFGTVYKAKDTRLERMVAIKTIRLEGLAASQAGVKDMLDRFEREAKTAAKLKHPGIVTIYDYDFGEQHGLSYIAMEFIDGIGLDRVIADSGRLPVERAAALGAQVADALDYAHKHQVVHRDIKPANIMIEAGDRVKVTDFGIAKPGDSADHLTQTGSLLGTPSYMSPEQARGQKLDGRSDLFALGCVIYEMVAGRKAFRGDSITALLFKIIAEEPQPLHELDPSLPVPLVRLIQRAIAKSPDLRFQSGREMADELSSLTRAGAVPTLRALDTPTLPPEHAPTISAAPTLSGPATAVSPSTLPPAANPTLPASAAPPLAPTILTPGTATAAAPPISAPPPVSARPAAPRPPQAAGRPAKGGSGLGLVLGLAAAGGVLLVAVAGGGWWFLSHRQPAGPAASPTPVAQSTQPTPTLPPMTEPATTPPAESGPPPATATPVPAATIAPHAPTTSQPPAGHRVAAGSTPGGVSQPAAGEPHTQPPPAAGSDYGFLNDVPQQGPDGREVGEALANAYRSGGSSGITNRRFNARPRVPRDVAPMERPAVATLLHIMFVEQAYQRQNGRYGNLHDLKTAGLLHLDVPFANGQFERRQYRFQLTGDGAEYKVTATPLSIGARPFLADDSGFVRVDE
jgi:serine/threonine protein kinase